MHTVPISPPQTTLTVVIVICRNEQTVFRTLTPGVIIGTGLALKPCHQHFQTQRMDLVG